MDLLGELATWVDELGKRRIPYALCGGMAVAIHGYPRFTQDIDLIIHEKDIDEITELGRNLGFRFSTGPMPFDVGTTMERTVYRLTKIENGDTLCVDFLVLPDPLEEIWNDLEDFLWQGRTIPIVSKRGLIHMKKLANRDQDLLDIKKLTESEEDHGE